MQSSLDLGIAEHALRTGNLALAGQLLRSILAMHADHPRANELMAYVAGNSGDVEAVGRYLKRATASPAAAHTAWYYLGVWLLRRGEHLQAIPAFEASLRIHGDFFEALHDLGYALHQAGKFGEALASYDRAAVLQPASHPLLHNQGRTLQALGRDAEALEAYERALAARSDAPETWLNRGEVLNDLGRPGDALDSYGRALVLRPDFDDARVNGALARLAMGDWKQGWADYEYRWKGVNAPPKRHSDIEPWTGDVSRLAGKRLLVWCEQGFGDTLQFCRYIPLLERQGASVVFEVQRPLMGLISANFSCEVVALGAGLPPCDLQVPLLSLPHAFETTTENAPATIPYLSADEGRVRKWRGQMSGTAGKSSIAIACSGRQTYRHEIRRQIALRDFATLCDRADLYLVQKELVDEDRAFLDEGRPGIRFFGDAIEDFRDGAAIAAACDLVISIDTALVHLAAAMGRPTWLLSPFAQDWRWLSGHRASPWYPTLTIFRQPSPGDWASVLSQVREDLAARK
jgi:tetratricopeptide (TPR) repeat protein